MKNFITYIDIQHYIKSTNKRWNYNQIKKFVNLYAAQVIQQYINQNFTEDDILFAIKRNIELIHHYCPQCGKEIHVYNLNRYPKTCSVSCGIQHSQNLRISNSIKKYGTKRPQQSIEVKTKIHNTMNDLYGGYTFQSPILMEKVKKTNLKEYGVEIAGSNKTLHKKGEKTCLKKYGVTHTSKLPENRKKAKQTNKERHGSENWNNPKQIKQTCLEKYGVENPTQCHDIRIKEQSKYFYDNKNFDSSWELAMYIWHVDHKIQFEFQPNIIFTYVYKKKKHTYHPDFLIDHKIYEVKGDQYFNKNHTKMVCPYNHKLDGLYNAKYKCMIKNNVIILQSIDIKKYLEYIYQKYGVIYLQQFKRK